MLSMNLRGEEAEGVKSGVPGITEVEAISDAFTADAGVTINKAAEAITTLTAAVLIRADGSTD